MEWGILLWIIGMGLFIVIIGVAFKKGYKEGYKEGVDDARKDFEEKLKKVINMATLVNSDRELFGVQSDIDKPKLP